MLASVALSSQDYIRKQANEPDSTKVRLLFDFMDLFPSWRLVKIEKHRWLVDINSRCLQTDVMDQA